MKIISRSKSGKVHEAELSSFEAAASQWFADNLDTSAETAGIEATARLALKLIPNRHLDPDYVEYLSDGTLKIGEIGTVVGVDEDESLDALPDDGLQSTEGTES